MFPFSNSFPKTFLFSHYPKCLIPVLKINFSSPDNRFSVSLVPSITIAVVLWSFCNSTRTFCNRICTFDVGVQGKVPIERWLFTREPKDRSSSLSLFLIIKPKFGLFLSMSLTHTPMLFRLDWCGFGRWGWLLNANLGKFQWWLKFVRGFANEL